MLTYVISCADVARTLSNYEKDLADLTGKTPAPRDNAPRPQRGFLEIVANKRTAKEQVESKIKGLEVELTQLRGQVAELDEQCNQLQAAVAQERLVAGRQEELLRQLQEQADAR